MEHCLQCDINMQCCLQLACHSVAHISFMNYKFFLIYILCGSSHTPIPHTCSCYAFHKYAPVSHTSMLNLIYLFFHFLWRIFYPITLFSSLVKRFKNPVKSRVSEVKCAKYFAQIAHFNILKS